MVEPPQYYQPPPLAHRAYSPLLHRSLCPLLILDAAALTAES